MLWRKVRGDRYRVRRTVRVAIVDHQLRDVGSVLVRHERRLHSAWIGKHRYASAWLADQRPFERERIAIGIAGLAAVQSHGLVHQCGLVRPRIGHRRGIDGSNGQSETLQ